MPNLEEHCRISKERTGLEYRELHKWMDESQKSLGFNHRIERHSDNDVYRNFIKEKFGGDKAIVEWLFHIAIDYLHTAYKASYKVYKDKRFNSYIFLLSESEVEVIK